MRKLPLDFPLYDNVYGNDFPDSQYYVIVFDTIPSRYSTNHNYSKDVMQYLEELGFREDCRIDTARKNYNKVDEALYVNLEKHMMLCVQKNVHKDKDLVTLEFVFDIRRGEIENQLDMEKIRSFRKTPKKSSIQLVKSDMGHLDTEEYDLPVPDFDIELNYGKEFIKLHETIIKRLNTPFDKGIIVLYGEHGTGKTTYIKGLTKLITKDILFIPPSMAEMLSEPSIIPFLMDHRNSILIIEDGEQVIGDRRGKASSAGVSNILNLTDGILGDCLNIQVIATCNIPREKIDPALLRKGRLICEHRFDKLSLIETNNLLSYLNKGVVSKIPLALADIYNIDVDAFRTPDPDPMGFKTPGR